jgi:hypothetical protein
MFESSECSILRDKTIMYQSIGKSDEDSHRCTWNITKDESKMTGKFHASR